MGMEYLQERLQGLGLEATVGGGTGTENVGKLEAGRCCWGFHHAR